jgi:hypothetical protein
VNGWSVLVVREVLAARDSKVDDPEARQARASMGAGRQGHRWVRGSIAKIAISPVAPKVVASSIGVSMVHHRDATSIAIDSPARRRAVASNANATRVVPTVRASNAIGSPAHAAANSNATVSQVRPNVAASNAAGSNVGQNNDITNATDFPVLPATAQWTASALPARPSVVTSMNLGHRGHPVRLSSRA